MKIKFAISSHTSFFKVTYPIIVKSLLSSGVNNSDIYFFIGGDYDYRSIHNDEGINLVTAGHNSFDFTGLISVLELEILSDYWFLMHDTCCVGKRFYNFVTEFEYDQIDTVKVTPHFSMNMGSYKQSYVNKIQKPLLQFKNTDYSINVLQSHKKKCVSNEDIFLDTENFYVYNKSKIIVEEPTDYYNNGISRRIEHFTDIDLYKIKANWYQRESYELRL